MARSTQLYSFYLRLIAVKRCKQHPAGKGSPQSMSSFPSLRCFAQRLSKLHRGCSRSFKTCRFFFSFSSELTVRPSTGPLRGLSHVSCMSRTDTQTCKTSYGGPCFQTGLCQLFLRRRAWSLPNSCGCGVLMAPADRSVSLVCGAGALCV